jgi:hypothetical protein
MPTMRPTATRAMPQLYTQTFETVQARRPPIEARDAPGTVVLYPKSVARKSLKTATFYDTKCDFSNTIRA